MIETDVGVDATARKLLDVLVRFRRHGWQQSSLGGLTRGEVGTLFHIWKAGEEDEAGAKVSDISTLMNVAPPSVTQQLNALEKQGYVERKMDKEDRRVVRVSLTSKGQIILKQASDDFLSSITGLVNYLGEQDSLVLTDLLVRVSDYFQRVGDASVQ
jgi:DNA-binding MarR family transcriptional regulator